MHVQRITEPMSARQRCLAAVQATLAAGLVLGSTGAASDANAKGNLAVTWDESASGTDLKLENYRLSFEENFDEKSLNGPKVFAPVHSPFGGSVFDQPASKAYEVVDGSLVINAYKEGNKWHSGSVQTADAAQSSGKEPFSAGKGFACGNCYFEARVKFPEGVVHGPWAAFWLLSPESSNGHTEIDVVEWYGGDPKGHHQTVHVWPKDRKAHAFQSNYTGMPAITDGAWHTYGAQVRDGTVYIYVDRKEISQVAVPGEFNVSYYAVVTLAVLEKELQIADKPFSIAVDYIRAYEPATTESE
jgi:hypothetical protein